MTEEMIQTPSANGVLSKEAILAFSGKLKKERVEVAEWGGAVYVREMTAAERDQFENDSVTRKPGPRGRTTVNVRSGFRARLVVRTVVDGDGNRVFDDAAIDSVMELGAGPIDKLYTVAARLSGISDEDEKELVGNSSGVPSDDSLSVSPSN